MHARVRISVCVCVCVWQVFGSHLMRVTWELNLGPLEKQWALNHWSISRSSPGQLSVRSPVSSSSLFLPPSFHKIEPTQQTLVQLFFPSSPSDEYKDGSIEKQNLPTWARAPYVFWLAAQWGASLMTFLILGPPSWPYIANAGCTYGASPFLRNCFYGYRFLSQP